MKTQINLLHNEFVPKFEWVCASHFFALVIFSLLLSAVGFGATHYYLVQEEQNVAALKSRLDTQEKSVKELSDALSARTSDPLLQSKITQLSTQTRAQTQLLNHIQNLSGLKQRSFSSLFDSLAQTHNKQLWLTDFEVTPNALNFQGQLAQPKALPLWISQLSKTNFFQGQEFNLASVSREQEQLTFSLNSVVADNSVFAAQGETTNED